MDNESHSASCGRYRKLRFGRIQQVKTRIDPIELI